MVKLMFKIILISAKIFVSILVSFFACYFGILILVLSSSDKYLDFQILLYTVASLAVLIGIWIICFAKTKIYTKIIYLLILLFWLLAPKILPSVMEKIDIDYNLDTAKSHCGIVLKV